MIFCTKCGKQNLDTAKFCTACGASLLVSLAVPAQIPTEGPKKKSRKTAKSLVVTLLLLIIAITGTYFLFFNRSIKDGNKADSYAIVSNADKEKLKTLIDKWNISLNNKDISSLSLLYNDQLIYYRIQKTRDACIEVLSGFLSKNPAFYQQIVGEIEIEQTGKDTVKCSFVKKATLNGKTTDYPSYLRFSKETGEWKIIEEGDLVTDKNIAKRRANGNVGEWSYDPVTTRQAEILNTWVHTNIDRGFTIDPDIIAKSGLNTTNYLSGKNLCVPKNTFYSTNDKKPKIIFSTKVITLDFSDDDGRQIVLLTENKVIRSYHLSAGSNGGTFICNLLSGKNTDYSFTCYEIKGNIISVMQDGYDSDGHYWQSGEFNLNSEQVKLGKIEH